MIRRIAFALILVMIWLGLLGWAAGLSWRAPLVPSARQALPGYDLHARFGRAERVGESLQVTALGEDGTGLQTAMTNRFVAANFPILRYRIENFPRTLELAVVFRRSDTPDDVQTISLPSPGSSDATVDLSSYPEWRGEITELGFAQYATAQLVPPSVARTFAPFRIGRVELESRAWSQLASRLRTDWFAYRPWALRSINTLGAPTETLKASSMQMPVGLGVLLSLIAAALILRLSRRELVLAVAFASIGGWVLLDLRWLDDLWAKHTLTETVYAGKSWEQRSVLQPDEPTLAAAQEVTRLAREANTSHVLVSAGSTYEYLRLIYFLLPLNTASLDEAVRDGAMLPRDALIALFDSEWQFDASEQTLKASTASYAVTPVFEKDALRVYRVREGGR
jgi:hypothetical protein